jgi:methylmalonyl-CoA carboxyltransferase large subunit
MPSDTPDLTSVADALEALRRELSRLGERVTALEAATASRSSAAPVSDGAFEPKANAQETAAPSLAPPRDEGLSEEVVLVISSAIAAYLGKKAHIRAIQLIGSAAWA